MIRGVRRLLLILDPGLGLDVCEAFLSTDVANGFSGSVARLCHVAQVQLSVNDRNLANAILLYRATGLPAG